MRNERRNRGKGADCLETADSDPEVRRLEGCDREPMKTAGAELSIRRQYSARRAGKGLSGTVRGQSGKNLSGTAHRWTGNGMSCTERRHQLRRRLLCFGIAAAAAAAGLIGGMLWLAHSSSPQNPDTAALSWAAGEKPGQEDSIPQSLLEFAEKYPEAQQFVEEYPEKKDLDLPIDLSSEVTEGTIPLLIQWDERWGYKTYGSDCMGLTGCGPTCLSMILCGLTGDSRWDPYTVAQYSQENGYYVPGTGTSWDLMTEGAHKLGLSAETGTISREYIRQHLSETTPMIASMTPGDFTYTGHFIVLTGMDEDGNVTVNDPNSRINSARTWTVETLLGQMKGLWTYSV